MGFLAGLTLTAVRPKIFVDSARIKRSGSAEPSSTWETFRMRSHQPAVAVVLLAALVLAVCPGLALAQPASSGTGGPAPGASVFFPEKAFEFQPVIEGAKVIHDFVVMNRGSAPLVISDVRTG
jgi:hypothetical protein